MIPNNGLDPVFPTPDLTNLNGNTVQYGSLGLSVRDYLASRENLTDWDDPSVSDQMARGLVGPRPEGNWNTNTLAFLKWEAQARAIARYVRADALIEMSKKQDYREL